MRKNHKKIIFSTLTSTRPQAWKLFVFYSRTFWDVFIFKKMKRRCERNNPEASHSESLPMMFRNKGSLPLRFSLSFGDIFKGPKTLLGRRRRKWKESLLEKLVCYLSRYISKLIEKTQNVSAPAKLFSFSAAWTLQLNSRETFQGLEWEWKGMSEQTKFQFVRHDL